MANSISELLKASRLFSSLDEQTNNHLLPKFSKVELKHNEVLFYQGDPSDSIFFLVQGKLAAEFTNASGDSRIMGYIEPGESVGELGTLSNEPRSLTIKALKDAVLLRLPAQIFVTLCYQYPAVMFATVRPLIARSKNIIQMIGAEKSNKHVVIVPAHKDVSLEQFSQQLSGYIEKYGSVLLLSDYQEEFGNKNTESAATKEKIQRIVKSKNTVRRIIYVLQSYDTPLGKIALKKADMIFIVAHHDSKPKIDQSILDKIRSRRLHLAGDPGLILLHPSDALVPAETSAWSEKTVFSLHHHVRMGNAKDFQRLLRFLRGKAVGVVLSGGGTRGWSHLGAIKALREAKIPIDIIGGTSVGALIAACYAIEESFEDAYERFYKVVTESSHSVSWRSLTWPAVSLFDADRFTHVLGEVFADLKIEDLWLPYFCVSCNLATATEESHRSGLLWEKIRASTSIPGLIPPMLIEGQLHLDGGLINNLPVDIMRQYVGSKGRIIAVELNSFAPDRHKYNFPPILTFREALFSKLGIGKNKYRFPRFVDTFLRGIFVGSLLKAKQNSLAANTFISLSLSKFRLLHSNPQQANRLIEIGYQEALKQIHQARDLATKASKELV